MKKILKLIGLTAVLLFFSAVLGLSAVNATGTPPILYVTKTKPQININEKVTIHALSVSQDQYGTAPESISFYVNSEKNPSVVCNNKHYCGMTYWVTEKVKGNKWYKFTVKSTYNDATATKTVYVFIKNKIVGEAPKAPEQETPTTPTSDQAPTYSQIITSNHQPKVGETFSATIYPSEKGAINLNKIDVLLDGKAAKTCATNNSIASCGAAFGPFTAVDVGEHKYEFLMVGINGKTNKPWGKFWVNAAPQAVDDYPEYDKVATSGDVVKVGEGYSVVLYAKPSKKFYEVERYFDNIQFTNTDLCKDISICPISAAPFKSTDVGEHTYKFVVKSKSGKSLEINGKLQVVLADEKDLKAPEVSISSDKDVLKINESATLTVTATDNKAVSKIQVLVFSGVVKECVGVNSCTYQIGPVSNKTYINKYTYSAYAYDAAGNSVFTGNKYVTVDISQPTPAIEPVISIEAEKSKINTTDTIIFKSNVNAGSKKLVKLQILVNQMVAKECVENVCEYTGGPFPAYVGKTVNYAATAYFSDGAHKTTGYSDIQVTDVPTVSIISTTQNPTDASMVTFAANATAGNKTIKHLSIIVNGKIEKTCSLAAACNYVGGPYSEYGGKTITYTANLFFTDDSIISADPKTLLIISNKQIEPKLTLKSDKLSAISKETFTLTAGLDVGSKKIETWGIFTGAGGIGKGGLTQYCSNSATACPVSIYALNTSNFHAEAKFTDGTIYKSDQVTITIQSAPSRTQ